MKIRAGFFLFLATSLIFASCAKKTNIILPGENAEDISSETVKSHQWFCFTENGFEEIDLPQNASGLLKKPWTEAIRISSAANIPSKEYARSGIADAYAIVNRLGVLTLDGGNVRLYQDKSIFSGETADSLVFSGAHPVFCLYRNTFFNEGFSVTYEALQQSRPFLVQFNPETKMSYPLVSYANLNLKDDEEISGFFWDGKSWACSIKNQSEDFVQFNYLSWSPIVNLSDLSPALNKDLFVFEEISESQYRALNTPRLFKDTPGQLKKLLSSIPQSMCVYVIYRDESGTSPKSYYQEGNGGRPLNAKAIIAPAASLVAAVFEDGTTYVKNTESDELHAFRLPKLPGAYKYGEVCISKKTMLVSWEETDFYKSGRSGFIKVDLESLLGI